jgi:flagellar assembly protein FliH
MTTADGRVTPWRTPPLAANGGDLVLEEAYAEELAALRAQAEAEGRAAGIEQATAEIRSRLDAGLDQLEVLLAAMRRPCDELDEELVDELARLAGHIAKQLLRRELKTSPEAIIGVVREAVASLPEDREGAKVYLNHEDVKLIEELTDAANQERGWDLHSDPAIARGDCIVQRGPSLVDASLDERVRVAMLQVLGGDRAEDGQQ